MGCCCVLQCGSNQAPLFLVFVKWGVHCIPLLQTQRERATCNATMHCGAAWHAVVQLTHAAAVMLALAGTDSEALGRLPHGGPAVSDYTAGTDSMDVDAMMGQSQGAASVQRTGGVTMDDEGDEDLEEEEEEDDDDGMAGEEDDDDVDEDTQEGQEEDGLEDDGLEGDDEDDMPG